MALPILDATPTDDLSDLLGLRRSPRLHGMLQASPCGVRGNFSPFSPRLLRGCFSPASASASGASVPGSSGGSRTAGMAYHAAVNTDTPLRMTRWASGLAGSPSPHTPVQFRTAMERLLSSGPSHLTSQ